MHNGTRAIRPPRPATRRAGTFEFELRKLLLYMVEGSAGPTRAGWVLRVRLAIRVGRIGGSGQRAVGGRKLGALRGGADGFVEDRRACLLGSGSDPTPVLTDVT